MSAPVEQHYAGHRASPPHNGPPHHPVIIKYTKLTHACNEQLLVGKPKMCSMAGQCGTGNTQSLSQKEGRPMKPKPCPTTSPNSSGK